MPSFLEFSKLLLSLFKLSGTHLTQDQEEEEHYSNFETSAVSFRIDFKIIYQFIIVLMELDPHFFLNYF